MTDNMTTRTAREKRIPLIERGERGEWSQFEAALFNFVNREITRMEMGEDGAPEIPRVLFSTRLAITQSMLDAFDSYFAGTVQ